MTQNTRITCTTCNDRIPKNRPKLMCDLCNCVKNYRCQNLSKRDANLIVSDQNLRKNWTCRDCMLSILPINAAQYYSSKRSKKHNTLESTITSSSTTNCCSCNRRAITTTMVLCPWCNLLSHRKCSNNSLGCDSCCETMIPGFHSHSYDLMGKVTSSKTYNPYSRHDLINQIGDAMAAEEGSTQTWT